MWIIKKIYLGSKQFSLSLNLTNQNYRFTSIRDEVSRKIENVSQLYFEVVPVTTLPFICELYSFFILVERMKEMNTIVFRCILYILHHLPMRINEKSGFSLMMQVRTFIIQAVAVLDYNCERMSLDFLFAGENEFKSKCFQKHTFFVSRI